MIKGKKKMPKAYSYLRFSTPEQAKGDSKRRQWQLAKEYADAHGLELDEELTCKFQDEGVSAFRGSNVETGELAEFRDAVRRGYVEPGSYLLVESLDRLSRQYARKSIRVLEDICDEGITVVTLSDGKVYTKEILDVDQTAFIMSILIFYRAHEESEMKSKRGKAVWTHKRHTAGSKPLTAKTPAWLTLDKKTQKIKIIPDRAEIVKRIYRMYLQGIGPKSIALKLNEEGHNTWGEGKRKGKYWYYSYVVKILANPAVIGYMVPHTLEYLEKKRVRVPQEAVRGYFPAVIDEETFNRAQELRKSNSGMKGMKSSVPLRNIFSRLAKCPLCGSNLVRVAKNDSDIYLACSRARSRAGCDFYRVRYDELEDVFLPKFLEGLMNLPRRDTRFNDVHNRLNTLRRTISRYDTELDRIVSMVKHGKRWPKLEEEMERLEKEKEIAKQELKKAVLEHASLKPKVVEYKIKEYVATVAKNKNQDIDTARLNALLRSLCKTIVVDDHKLIVEFAHGPVQEISRVYNSYRFIN
jgi:DNA invertase Pin-like site-specific DNA recombinase